MIKVTSKLLPTKPTKKNEEVNILILKTILFIPQNLFQSINTSSSIKLLLLHTSSSKYTYFSLKHNKNCKYSKFICLLKMLAVMLVMSVRLANI